jgi:segregation and condensation protein B
MAEAHIVAGLEALLFSTSEPVALGELARVLGVDESVVAEALSRLEADYCRPERGFMLERVAGGFRLASKPDYASLIVDLLRPVRNSGLSQAALETLAIVAYKQPVTRAEVEAIRGVRAEAALNSLLERELVEECGRKEAPGRPILYRTTERFLVEFGLQSLEELPPLADALEEPAADTQATGKKE